MPASADSASLALFLVGLFGGTHCVGMCGGIVGALSMGGAPRLPLHLAYNLGRIASYAVAGALAGAVGGAVDHVALSLSGQMPLRLALYVAANLMLVALGFYLLGATRVLAFTERIGQNLWRRIEPLGRRFLPARTPAQAFPLGLLWGWLPCGLVYSALATALTAGSAEKGALLMLAFGLGTLPNLLLAGFLLARLRRVVQRPAVRLLAGSLIAGFGVWGLFGAWRLAQAI